MSDFIIIDGDKVVFDPMFDKAIVIVLQPYVTIEGTGKTSLNSKAVCVEGDEAKVKIPICFYITPSIAPSYGGIGTLTISSLGGDQKAQKTRSRGKAVLLKGSKFKAEFTVKSAAPLPGAPPGPPHVPNITKYTGKGAFETNNDKYKAT